MCSEVPKLLFDRSGVQLMKRMEKIYLDEDKMSRRMNLGREGYSRGTALCV